MSKNICFFINDVKLSTVKYILDSSDKIFEKTKKDFKSIDFIKYEIFKGYEDVYDDDAIDEYYSNKMRNYQNFTEFHEIIFRIQE